MINLEELSRMLDEALQRETPELINAWFAEQRSKTNKYNKMITYQYYDKKGRRLTISAEQKDSSVRIEVITCSLDDSFCKKVGREALVTGKGGFTVSVYTLSNTLLTLKVFLSWCDANFFKKRVVRQPAEVEVLYSPKTKAVAKKRFIKLYNKMG